MAKWEWTEGSIDAQFDRAEKAGRLAAATESRAKVARYDQKSGRIVVDLANGASFMFPVKLVQGLNRATSNQLAAVEVVPQGRALHWEALDVDLSVTGLLLGVFGTKTWMRELGKRGGARTSKAKAAAARKNGRKGGRPVRAAVTA
jgi:hypothetical protein